MIAERNQFNKIIEAVLMVIQPHRKISQNAITLSAFIHRFIGYYTNV